MFTSAFLISLRCSTVRFIPGHSYTTACFIWLFRFHLCISDTSDTRRRKATWCVKYFYNPVARRLLYKLRYYTDVDSCRRQDVLVCPVYQQRLPVSLIRSVISYTRQFIINFYKIYKQCSLSLPAHRKWFLKSGLNYNVNFHW